MNLRNYFIRANSAIGDSIDRKRAELLSILLIGRGFVFVAILTYLSIMGPQAAMNEVYIAFLINFVAYGVSRSRYYRAGAILIITEGLIIIPTVVLSVKTLDSISSGPLWLGLGTLVSSLILPLRHTILTIIATAIAMIFIGVHIDKSHIPILGGIFLFTMASSFLTLLGTYLRDKSDQLLEIERAKVIHVSKLSALGEMAGGIAHEINTPLGAMIMNAEMIDMKNSELSNPDPEISQRVAAIVSIGNRISKIIGSLKNLSRDEKKDEKKNFTVKELIDCTIDLCSEKFKNHGVALKIHEGHLDSLIYGQIIQLSQTLLNLLNNSYDAIHDNAEKWIQIQVVIKNEKLELRVSDSGYGIAPHVVEKIFNPFFTTKDIGKGTGLGLSISREIVRHHGGELFCDMKSPNTCFVIGLPVVKDEKVAA